MREIRHVNVVADAGAVRGRIIDPEYLEMRSLAKGNLAGDFDEMGRGGTTLSAATLRVGPRDIEVAEGHVPEVRST